ncbi:bifunctional diguanylate cyclase/phosphodiesterase [Amphritea sp. HPY]|uniref:bifunctional diguanylate cyclase/phosphodiesterase n=1 Tax=Amphritea sp. HPY TaxID=3421652 RepID=UPI003D7C7C03
MTLTLRHKIILAFVFSIIFGVLLVSVFLERSLKNFAIENWANNQSVLINALRNQIGGEIERAQSLLEFTARMPEFRRLLSPRQIDLNINGIPELLAPLKHSTLSQLVGDNGPFSVVFLLLPNGDHYLAHPFSVQQKLQRYNLSDREYFKQTARTLQTSLSDSFIGADGKLAIAIDVPILNYQGELIAHLGGVVHLNDLSRLITTDTIKPFDEAFLLDRKGLLIAHSDPENLALRTEFSEQPLLQQWHAQINTTPPGNFLVKQSFNTDKVQLLSFITNLPSGWSLVIQRRVDSIIDDFNRHIINTTTLVALILLSVSGFGIWISTILSGRWVSATRKLETANNTLEINVATRTRELDQTRQQLQLALEGSNLGLWDWYIDDGVTSFNENWASILGYQLAELQPTDINTWLALIHPDDQHQLQRFRQQDINYPHVDCEMRMQDRSGHWIWVECRGMVVQYSELGAPSRLIGTLQNISGRKRNEIQLRQSARVFEHAHEGIMISDSDNNIIDVNTAFCELTGYSRNEVIGRNPNILSSGRQDKDFYKVLWHSISQKGYWKGEVWNRRKDGKLYAEQLTITALKNSQGVVDQYIGIFSDITDLKENQQRLVQMAHYDALTGLPNRILLADRLAQALSHTARMENLLAVAYLDLDDFKPINDQLGHDIGDKLLVAVANRLQESIRADDTTARLGGDEFVLLLPELESVEQSNIAFDRVTTKISEPYYINDHKINLSASIGISLYPIDNSDADTLLRHADQAMYTAKQCGRNCYHYFDPSLEQVAKKQQDALSEIQNALTTDQFVLHYQPKVDMALRKVLGVEALIRWQHPDRGLVFPNDFLPTIENSNLATELGHWVLNQALWQLNQWHLAGLKLNISVNIAARHLESADFIPRLQALLANYPQLPKQALELEILETTALEELDRVANLIEQCHQLGVTVALDDFGTGYSSLTYFKRLPIDTVKIDRSFVIDMLDDEEDFTIVEGVIGLADAFHRTVIAEGVETELHGYKLQALGCRFAQGYGIARAMPAEQLSPWIEQYQATETLPE